MDLVKTRSSLLAIGLLAMAVLPDESSAQQGVPSRYGYQGETRQPPRPQQVAPRPAPVPRGAYVVPARAPRPAPKPAAAAPVRKTVASAPKKAPSPKPAVAKAVPEKKPKTAVAEPKKKVIAKTEPVKKAPARNAPKAVAAATQKQQPSSKNAGAERPVNVARNTAAANRLPAAPTESRSREKITAATSRKPSGVTARTASAPPAGPHFLGMRLPAAWFGAAVPAADTRHTVDVAGAQRDLESAQPKRTAQVKATPRPEPVSAPAPPPEPPLITPPDTSLAAREAAPAPVIPGTDMAPPPEANIPDSARAQDIITDAKESARVAVSNTGSPADEMPPTGILTEPEPLDKEPAAEPEPLAAADPAGDTTELAESEDTPPAREEPEPSAALARQTTPNTDPGPAREARVSSPVEAEDPGIDLLTGLPRENHASPALLEIEEPPLPSNDAPPAREEENEPSTRTASLENRDQELVRTIKAAVKGAADSKDGAPEKSVNAVKNVASQWFDDGKAPRISEVKAAAREALADRVPDLPLDIASDLLPSRPEAMPDRMPKFNAPATGKIDIQSDRQADYDQVNNRVTFTGKVELNSSTLRLRADRVEVTMKKNGGMDVIHATGNVLMRTQDTGSSSGQIASAGAATYDLKTGGIVLSEWPRIQESGKSLISTDPSTKMYLYTDGRLRTEGPNRTIIGR